MMVFEDCILQAHLELFWVVAFVKDVPKSKYAFIDHPHQEIQANIL